MQNIFVISRLLLVQNAIAVGTMSVRRPRRVLDVN